MQRYFSKTSIHSIENSDVIRLGDLVKGAWRYRWSTIALILLLIPLFAICVFLIPARYNSSARLLVRLGRGAVSIDPTANLSQTVSLQESRLAQVNSVKELLVARELSERVVRRVGVDRILEPHGLLETTLDTTGDVVSKFVGLVLPLGKSSDVSGMTSEDVEDHLKLEQACAAFEEDVFVASPKDAYTISLDIMTGDPILSRDLMQAYVDEYLKYHVESYQATGSLAFFEDQTNQAKERAIEAQNALRDMKTNRGIVDIEAAKRSMSASLSELKQQMLAADSELAAAKAEANVLVKQIAELPENIDTMVTRGIPSLAGGNIRQRLYDLEVAYQDAAAKLTPDHPKMITIRQQLEAATKIAQTESGDKPQTQESINPVRQQLMLALQTTNAKIAGTEKRRSQLEEQFAQMNVDLSRLNDDTVEINELTWEAKLAEEDYLRTASARAKARQIDVLDDKNLSEISLVQPPTLVLKKASPKRVFLLIVAVFLAIALGVGQAILRSLFVVPPRRQDDFPEENFYQERKIESRTKAWNGESRRAVDGVPAPHLPEIDSQDVAVATPR